MTKNENRYELLDALKAICAFIVILIHVKTPYHDFFSPITYWAVPCFFMISGFCLYGDKDILSKRLNRAIKRTSHILLWSSVLYFPLALLYAFQTKDFSAFSIDAIFDLFINCNHSFACHLWYLVAYLYTLVIIFIFNRIDRLNTLLFAIIPLFFCGSLPFLYCQNLLSKALPFVLLGMLVKKMNERMVLHGKLKTVTLKRFIAPISEIGRQHSLFIYIFHIWVLFVWEYILQHFLIGLCLYYSFVFVSPFIVFFLSWVLSIVITTKFQVIGRFLLLR